METSPGIRATEHSSFAGTAACARAPDRNWTLAPQEERSAPAQEAAESNSNSTTTLPSGVRVRYLAAPAPAAVPPEAHSRRIPPSLREQPVSVCAPASNRLAAHRRATTSPATWQRALSLRRPRRLTFLPPPGVSVRPWACRLAGLRSMADPGNAFVNRFVLTTAATAYTLYPPHTQPILSYTTQTSRYPQRHQLSSIAQIPLDEARPTRANPRPCPGCVAVDCLRPD